MKNKLDKKKYIEYLGTNLIRIVQGLYDNTMNFIEGNKKRPNQRKKKTWKESIRSVNGLI